jgi:hypothetical protein
MHGPLKSMCGKVNARDKESIQILNPENNDSRIRILGISANSLLILNQPKAELMDI